MKRHNSKKFMLDDAEELSNVSDDLSPSSSVVMVARDVKGRTKYTTEEDIKMLTYIMEEGRQSALHGMQLYKDMEALKITNHSASSMNARIRKTVVPNIDQYDVPDRWKRMLSSRPADNKNESRTELNIQKSLFFKPTKMKSNINKLETSEQTSADNSMEIDSFVSEDEFDKNLKNIGKDTSKLKQPVNSTPAKKELRVDLSDTIVNFDKDDSLNAKGKSTHGEKNGKTDQITDSSEDDKEVSLIRRERSERGENKKTAIRKDKTTERKGDGDRTLTKLPDDDENSNDSIIDSKTLKKGDKQRQVGQKGNIGTDDQIETDISEDELDHRLLRSSNKDPNDKNNNRHESSKSTRLSSKKKTPPQIDSPLSSPRKKLSQKDSTPTKKSSQVDSSLSSPRRKSSQKNSPDSSPSKKSSRKDSPDSSPRKKSSSKENSRESSPKQKSPKKHLADDVKDPRNGRALKRKKKQTGSKESRTAYILDETGSEEDTGDNTSGDSSEVELLRIALTALGETYGLMEEEVYFLLKQHDGSVKETVRYIENGHSKLTWDLTDDADVVNNENTEKLNKKYGETRVCLRAVFLENV